MIKKYSLRSDARVMLISEDYRAVQEFLEASAKKDWKTQIYEPGVFPKTVSNIHHSSPMVVRSEGHDVATGSLVALLMCAEAHHVVGTSTSNWSRVIWELIENKYPRDSWSFTDLTYLQKQIDKNSWGK